MFGLWISTILRGLTGLTIRRLAVRCLGTTLLPKLLGLVGLSELLAGLAIRCLTIGCLLGITLLPKLLRLPKLLARLAVRLLPVRCLLGAALLPLSKLLAGLAVRCLTLCELLAGLLPVWLLPVGCIGVASLVRVPLLLQQKEDDAADDGENAHSDKDPYPD